MSQISPDCISIDELFKLKREIDSFLNAENALAEALSEGDEAYEYIKQQSCSASQKLRKRIRGIAVEWGIHREFLAEYESLRSEPPREVAPTEVLAA
jgi:hypothetical protein